MYTDQQKLPVSEFNGNFYILLYALIVIKCGWILVHVKLTHYAEEI